MYSTTIMKEESMRKYIVCSLILAVLLAGCTGPFRFTRSVYPLHHTQQNKWMDEMIFLVCVPVYAFALCGDMVIFNTVQFWTGRNPLAMKEGTVGGMALNGEHRVLLGYDASDGTVEVCPAPDGEKLSMPLRTNEGVLAVDPSGKALWASGKE
jgi:hypothetical protein